MAGAWYYADHQYCVVKTTVVRIYGAQQWCPDAPSVIRSYNIHEWNRLFPGYYCPPLSHCGQPPQTGGQPPAPSAPPASGGSVVSSGARGVTSGVAGPGEPGKVYTGPKPTPAEPGCAPAMAVVDEELSQGRFSGDGKTGVGEGGFGFSGVDQLAQPLVVGMTPLTVQGDNGRPSYTQEPRFDLRDELGHQTVHAFHEGTADGILCFHPPELIDYMLHGSGTNPDSRWPTNLSQATVLLHNCSRADASTGDVSITRLAFGNPLKGSVLPKSGQYLQYTASTGVLNLVGTDANGASSKAHHLRLDVALDIPQYSDAERALLASHRAGTIIWNTDNEVYQYWDGSAWQTLTVSGGALADPGGNGIVVRTSAGVTTNRSIAVSGDAFTVANADGTTGDPTLAAAADLENIVDTWAVDASGNVSGIGTLSSAATTETVADSVAGKSFGVDATKGPYEARYCRSLTTAGSGAAETLLDVPTVTDSSGEVFVQLECTRSTGDLAFSYRGGIAFNNDGDVLTLGTQYTINGDDFGGDTTYAVSFVVSGRNVRVRITDNSVVVRCKAIVTRFHGDAQT